MSESTCRPEGITALYGFNTTIQPNSDTVDIFTPVYIIIICFQVSVCVSSVLGNLVMIRVIYNFEGSKLRDTTKLLLSYVSATHCIFSVIIVCRFFQPPCQILLLGAINVCFNNLSGITLLAYEAFVLVTWPYSHHQFVNTNICKVGIFITCLISVCIDIGAYGTLVEPDDPALCLFTNKVFPPAFLLPTFGLIAAMIAGTATIQICTLKKIKRVFPVPNQAPTVEFAANNQVVTIVTQPPPNSGSPFHRLTKILSVSILSFIICWCPVMFCVIGFSVSQLFGAESGTERQVLTTLISLLIVHGQLHVIIYLVMSTQIRQAVRKYLRSWICCCDHEG